MAEAGHVAPETELSTWIVVERVSYHIRAHCEHDALERFVQLDSLDGLRQTVEEREAFLLPAPDNPPAHDTQQCDERGSCIHEGG